MKSKITRSLSTLILVFFSLILFNSCKRDLLEPDLEESKSEKSDKITSNGFSLETVTFKEFKKDIDINKLGKLKYTFEKQEGNSSQIKLEGSQNNDFIIVLDSVKKIISKEKISYIFRIKQSSPRAVSFRNLTIEQDKEKNNINSFITLYEPDQKWIKAFKNKEKVNWSGKISFSTIDLSAIQGPRVESERKVESYEICTTMTILVEVNYACEDQSQVPAGLLRMCTKLVENSYLECHTVVGGSTGSGGWVSVGSPGDGSGTGGNTGGGSGGTTTPNPPSEYDPCDSGPIGTIGIESINGIKVFVAEPTSCDPNNQTQTAKQFLMQYIPISDPQIITKLGENDDRIAKQFGIYLSNNGGLTPENIDFINWASNYLTYTPNVDFDDFKQEYLESIYPPYQFDSEVQSFVSQGSFTTLPSAAIAGLHEFYTNSETTNVINNFNNEVTGDPIELYMIACYKESKLLNLSTYSISSHQYKVGDYYLTPHFDASNHLVFYSAFRNQTNGIEMIIRGDAVAQFIKNYKTYKAAANLFYLNGQPSLGQIQIASGDYMDGLMNMWGDALKSPEYYVYVANIFVATSTNLQTVRYTNITTKNSRNPNYRIDSQNWQEYKNAISAKNGPWQPTSNPDVFIIEKNGYKWSARAKATDWYYGYSIDLSKNNKLIGKFRFIK